MSIIWNKLMLDNANTFYIDCVPLTSRLPLPFRTNFQYPASFRRDRSFALNIVRIILFDSYTKIVSHRPVI